MSSNQTAIPRSNNEGFSRTVPIKLFRQTQEIPKGDLDATLIGDSEVMRNLKRSIRVVATTSETVLITGESGTGKELIARAIHDLSARRNKPFLPINCAALTESLLESELFGHVKGSFTGAITNKKGYFEAASGGTIFLDEFAELSLGMQQRLLRVLQEGKVRPVGCTDANEVEIDSRVVVATNHDLKRDVLEGTFRKDLYYRVNVLEINAPALRHRKKDILQLVQHFIRKYNEKNARQIGEQIAPKVLSILENYSWPGNVRELENITKRLALKAEQRGMIHEADGRSIPELSPFESAGMVHCVEPTESPWSSSCLGTRDDDQRGCPCSAELKLYRLKIEQSLGNVAEAARRLNMPRSSLSKRMETLIRRCGP